MPKVEDRTPFPIKIVGNNWFNTGWICGFLGLTRPDGFCNPDNPMLDFDIDAFDDGLEMGKETPNDARPLFQAMIEAGQIRYW